MLVAFLSLSHGEIYAASIVFKEHGIFTDVHGDVIFGLFLLKYGRELEAMWLRVYESRLPSVSVCNR